MKAIVKVPNLVLTTPAQPVKSFDKHLAGIIADMKQTLTSTVNPKGVGLAAPQIGIPYRIFLTRPSDSSEIRVFINPEIIKFSKRLTDGVPERENKLEGCLSIPGIWGKVKRSQSLTLRYQDEKGRQHTESYGGFLATIIQHETDHVNGILYTRRAVEQKGNLYQAIKDKEGKEALEEIELQ